MYTGKHDSNLPGTVGSTAAPRKISDLAAFLTLLKGVRKVCDGYVALCPGHDDHDPSLSVREADRRILVYCHAGCRLQDILNALGLEAGDLFFERNTGRSDEKSRNVKPRHRKTVAIYHYTDADGKPYEAVRTEPKGFFYRQPDGKGGYTNNLEGIALTLYRQEEVKAAIECGEVIYVVEGEKDADKLRSLGFVATTNPMGAGKWRDAYSETLRGGNLVIIPDGDRPGRKHTETAAQSCLGRAAKIRVLELHTAKDVTEWLEQGHTAEELVQLTDACSEYRGRAEHPDETKPLIAVGNRQLRDMTADCLSVLYLANGSNPEIFQRGTALVRVVSDKGAPCIDVLDEAGLRGMLARSADFIKKDSSGKEVGVPPPLDIVRDILALKRWDFAYLSSIVRSPILRPDGTILSVPGYDETTELFYHSDLTLPPISEAPTPDDIRDAVMWIKELLWDFPFDSEASRANAVAALFTPVLRPLVDGPIPLAVIDKPQKGTGASLLCELVALVFTGMPAGMIGGFRNDEEWRKNITTMLQKGHQIVIVDNIDGTLSAPSLATLLTSRLWRDRLLGHNEEVFLPNASCWFANGNNIRLRGDLTRRAHWIHIDAQEAQPWLRPPKRFRHPNLIAWATENQGNVLAAMLTITRGWLLAGRPIPENAPVLGSFESWCHTLAGVLEFIKIRGFLGNLQAMYAKTDPEAQQWEFFFTAWWQTIGDKAVPAAEVAVLLRDNEFLRYTLPDKLGDPGDTNFTRKLGTALSRWQDVRLTNGLVITMTGTKQRAGLWRVREAGDEDSPIISFKSEFRESDSVDLCVRRGEVDRPHPVGELGEKTEGNTPEQHSPNSSLGTKPSESSSPDVGVARSALVSTNERQSLIAFWRSQGAPPIYLGPGEDCRDLGNLLSNPNVLPRHLEAVQGWAKKGPRSHRRTTLSKS